MKTIIENGQALRATCTTCGKVRRIVERRFRWYRFQGEIFEALLAQHCAAHAS